MDHPRGCGGAYPNYTISRGGNYVLFINSAWISQKKGKFDIRGGIIRNKLGIGASYKKDKWKFDADIFDPNDLTVRLRGAYEAYPGIYAVGQSIFPHGRHGGGEYIGLGYAY